MLESYTSSTTLQVILNRDEYLDFRLLRLEKGLYLLPNTMLYNWFRMAAEIYFE